MSKIDNFVSSINWAYSPAFKTILVDTKRTPPKTGTKKGDPVTYLENVASSPLILPSQQAQQAVRAALGMEGTAVQLWELRMHKSTHLKEEESVTELPDIVAGDRVVIDSQTYAVQWADTPHPYSFGQILMLYITEDKRA